MSNYTHALIRPRKDRHRSSSPEDYVILKIETIHENQFEPAGLSGVTGSRVSGRVDVANSKDRNYLISMTGYGRSNGGEYFTVILWDIELHESVEDIFIAHLELIL